MEGASFNYIHAPRIGGHCFYSVVSPHFCLTSAQMMMVDYLLRSGDSDQELVGRHLVANIFYDPQMFLDPIAIVTANFKQKIYTKRYMLLELSAKNYIRC